MHLLLLQKKLPTIPDFNVGWVLGVFLFVLFDLQLLGTVGKFKAKQVLSTKEQVSFLKWLEQAKLD